MHGSEETQMKLSLGPVLFYWDKEHLGRFYSDMAGLPLDVIYLGETVCAKRRHAAQYCANIMGVCHFIEHQ